MKTKVFADTYKGQPVIAVWEVDVEDKKVGRYPIISFGAKKAQVLLNHIDDIRHFLDNLPQDPIAKAMTEAQWVEEFFGENKTR